MLKFVRASDVGLASVVMIVSVLAFDLLPGPTSLIAVLVGGTGWLELRRGRPIGRRLVDAFVGMLLALGVILVLAFVVR